MTTTTREPDTGEVGPALGLAEQFRPILLRLDLLVRRQSTQYALSRAQTSILHTLACHGRLRMTDLARLENVRVPTISNSVSVIEAMGYVEREPHESDRRGVCVRLTDLGRARIEQVVADRDRDFAEHLGRLTGEHRELLSAAVPAFNALLDAFDAGTAGPA
ncbi:MarR family winged helix-turn-helix transcriptional regulator [Dietzia cinnamea]|uniref:MarR family winged helix-turn-helix transcriptional regulator n=1 Tax=Dietzia cinnamea TaxID=321318 RepID=UPI0021A7FA43|nr:MarR family transcriptional regulator [Dietzia cinnamea]MCT2122058.1 MarR family transcriptional regulator [Dietzia cinnamea]